VNIPTFSATQILSPQQQAIQDQNTAAQMNLAGMANYQSGRLSQHLSSDFDLANAPGAGDASAITGIQKAPTTFADVGQQQSTFGDAGEITRSYGPQDSFSADRSRVEDALYGRLNPQLQRERGNIEQRLADQGIRYGSQAYASAMDDYNRQANDARLGVTAAGGAEQQRMMDMAAKQAGFQNTAQQQAYEQAMGRGTFANQAQGQNFSQAAMRGQFEQSGLAQQLAQAQSGFNAQNMARNQYITEQYQARNQPINEISALMSGSQVQNPNFVNAQQPQIPTTDVAGLINTRFNQEMDIYKQESAQQQALMGGIFGLAGGMLKSDRREKEDAHKIATVFAAGDDGERKELPIYDYAYKADPEKRRHLGPMAQDVEKIDRRAVKTREGVKYIDTGRVMGSILRGA
jgi:hypothetical protein